MKQVWARLLKPNNALRSIPIGKKDSCPFVFSSAVVCFALIKSFPLSPSLFLFLSLPFSLLSLSLSLPLSLSLSLSLSLFLSPSLSLSLSRFLFRGRSSTTFTPCQTGDEPIYFFEEKTNCHIVLFPYWLLSFSPLSHFTTLPFYHWTILPLGPFTTWPFYLLAILPLGHFTTWLFYHLAISPFPFSWRPFYHRGDENHKLEAEASVVLCLM